MIDPPSNARRRPAGALCMAAVAAFAGTAMSAANDAATDARAIMASVYAQSGSHDTSIKASFEIFDQDGHHTQKKFTYRRIGAVGNSRTLVVFTDPEEVRGVALLSITEPGVSVAQFIYTPATERVRSVAPQQRTARFLGTDFTLEDIQVRELDDFTYRLLGSAELIDGHRTYKIEAHPVNAASSQYRSINYWVAQDAPVIINAEMYDAQGMKARVEHANEIRRIAGIWGAQRIEMQTVREGTRTVLSIHELKFNTGLDEKQFRPEALETAPPPTGVP
jgi:hypothetical protein